jgi:hypothetical protein
MESRWALTLVVPLPRQTGPLPLNLQSCPVATESLERRSAMTSVSSRESVPQPDTNLNFDPGGDETKQLWLQ